MDQTTQAIAGMLRLDLSNTTDPNAASQIVIEAVAQLVMEIAELESQQEQDEQQRQQAEQDALKQQQPPVSTLQAPPAGPGVNPNPANTNLTAKGLAASMDTIPKFSKHIVNMAKKGRIATLQTLINNSCLTLSAAQMLEKRYISDAAISLSLSMEESDGFDENIELVLANGPVSAMEQLSFSDKLGTQGDVQHFKPIGQGALSLSVEEQKSAATNPLIACAEEMAAQEAKRRQLQRA